jgi:hypothetical protein
VFNLVADRELLTPYAWKKDHDWRPNGVGLLELPPKLGRFYCHIPHDSLPVLLTSMAHGLYRYVVLRGPVLKRGKSLSNSISFARTIDLDEY